MGKYLTTHWNSRLLLQFLHRGVASSPGWSGCRRYYEHPSSPSSGVDWLFHVDKPAVARHVTSRLQYGSPHGVVAQHSVHFVLAPLVGRLAPAGRASRPERGASRRTGLRPAIQAAPGQVWRDNGSSLTRPPRRFPLAALEVLRERLPLGGSFKLLSGFICARQLHGQYSHHQDTHWRSTRRCS